MAARITISVDELVRLKADARGFSFLPKQPVHSLLSGRHASRLRGRGLAFEEIRGYVQGDDVRTIDWKVTARLRSPHVRVYTEERERPVLLVVDQRQPMFFGSRRAMKSVTAAELAGLAAWRTLDSGDRVGGIVFNEEEKVILRPQRSQHRVMQLLHELARFNERLAGEPLGGEGTLNAALESALNVARHDFLVVLISDLDGADDRTRELATRIAAHNDMLVVAVYDPLGINLQNHEGMLAEWGGDKYPVPGEEGFREAFQSVFADVLERWTSIFRALRVPVLPLSTVIEPAEQIRELFGQKMGSP